VKHGRESLDPHADPGEFHNLYSGPRQPEGAISMSLQYMPQNDVWERTVKQYKLKDNGLIKAIDDFWNVQGNRDDEFDKALAQLPKILKLATDLKKAKDVMAVPVATKYLADLIAVVPVTKKALEDKKATAAKTGMQEIDVQIMIKDWNGKPMSSDYVAFVQFSSPGASDTNTTVKIGSAGVTIHNIHLRPSGGIYLMVRDPSSANPYCEGDTDYEFKPGKNIIKFQAIQYSRTAKVSAKTTQEASQKLGIKGDVGVEFKVVKVGGEVSKESEYKNGYEEAMEWEVEYGQPTFKDFKQL
jgi:hypothetical protein